MSKEKKSKEEDIELGSLLILIGKGFSKVFIFIASIFTGLFHWCILALLFVKMHLKKLLLAAAIGAGIGGVIEIQTTPTYGANLLVQPNFNSARQLYNNIQYYNELVKQKDTVMLSKSFGISNESAASLKKFEIAPVKNENDLLEAYDDLILSVDTLTAKSYSFSQFKNTFTRYDYKVQNIHVMAKQNAVFTKLEKGIVSSVIENDYFKKVKKLNNENLNRTDSLLRKNLTQIDSLRQVYMQVMLEEAKKTTTGTSIDLGGQRKSTKEIELFETNRIINKDLKELAKEKSEKTEVLNIISGFQPVGYVISGIDNNYITLLAGLGAGLMFFVLLMLKLNKYLNNYKQK
ncbi:hypothetical protein GCM10011416_08490 [Polaribacter pacificus]|uniref:Chain length determinant protein n=1 Tax=Polaribacter pacificus TaxID=1775173 RepID=A0A917MD16_9FLAO|nr:hypothetical protein [Polaribacter pacificus]GGG93613.1 hypothetical protein GCM10011416_08490 [Polaribacter pacificus]